MNKNKAYDIASIFYELELELAEDIGKRLATGKISDINSWKLEKLQGFATYRKHNTSIVKRVIDSFVSKAKSLIRNSFLSGKNKHEKAQLNAIERGYKALKQAKPIGLLNTRAINSLIKAVDNDFTNVSNAILRQMDDVYRQTIFKTVAELNAGNVTLPKAIDKATSNFLALGINSIIYANGNRVNVASYAEMYLRTASQRAFLAGEGERRKEWGESLIIFSSKGASCKYCVRWYGKVAIDDVYSGGKKKDYKANYPLVSQAIKDKWGHPNCKDTFSTFFEGINTIPKPKTKDEIKETTRIYDLQQKQRKNERDIRDAKRKAVGTVDPTAKAEAQKKVKTLQEKQRNFINKSNDDTGREILRRDYTREKLRV